MVQYIKGKSNKLADYLSRNPFGTYESEEYGPWITDDFRKEITEKAYVWVTQSISKYEDKILSNPLLEVMRDAGAMHNQYTAVIKALR